MMKQIAIKIEHGLVVAVIAEEEVELVILNVDGGHEDQEIVMNGCRYFVEEYVADVNKREIEMIKKALRQRG
ncbi:hypothetical protein [Lysinibacillus sp. LZ02]|uniref:hypothetical protein n=1 Tax=Lysinibacillus sp. LZ02 TaxID=3420668 RepID=UPI003D36C708